MQVRKLLLLCFAVISSLGFSQFKFNEYCCANVGNVTDKLASLTSYNRSPDWVEIINTTNVPQNLSGYYISNNRNNNNSNIPSLNLYHYQINQYGGHNINVDSFGVQLILLCTHNTETITAGYNPSSGVDLHANFQLNQTQNQTLYLFNIVGSLVDSVSIQRLQPDHSWGKPNSDSAAYYPDTTSGGVGFGLNAWRLYKVATPGLKNPNNYRPNFTTPIPNNYYLGYAPTPKFMSAPGYFSSSSTLTIKDTTAAVYLTEYGVYTNIKDSLEIFVTTNCSNPITTIASSTYPSYDYGPINGGTGTPINLPLSGGPSPPPTPVGIVVRAVMHDLSVRPNYVDGFEAYGAYILDSTYHMAVSCFCIDTTNLFTAPVGIQANDTVGTYSANPYGMSTIFCYVSNSTKKQVFQNQGQGLVNRIDFLNTPTSAKRQWQFQFRSEDEYGYNYSNRYAFFTDPSLGPTPRADFPELVFRSSAEDNFLKGGIGGITRHGATHLRDFFNHTITLRHKLDFESAHYVPTYLFINGVNRGIYYVKEPIDTTYTNYYYNHPQADIIANDLMPTTTTAQITALSGKLTDWTHFYTWAMSNGFNVHNPTLYQLFSDSVDIQSFIDYNFYNMFSVNTNFNTNQALWWKGYKSDTADHPKWRFGLSNTDATWGLFPYNNTGVNPQTNNSPCDYISAAGSASNPQHPLMPLFAKLMNNDTFQSAFYSRYQDLLNSSYSCDSLTTHLAYVQSLLKSDIPSQSWWNIGADSAKFWAIMVDTMNAFIMQRCSLALQSIASSICVNTDGPYNLCISVQPANAGNVNFNSLSLTSFTWNGSYIDSVTYHAYAIPDSNYVFDHWQTTYSVNPNNTTDSITFMVNQSACLTAVFALKPPNETTGTPMLPEAFSPNGDGINDILNVYGIVNATSYTFFIYNRWGEQLFYSTDKTQGWNGTYPNGTPAEVGVYAYRYDIVVNGKTYIKNGNVTLLR